MTSSARVKPILGKTHLWVVTCHPGLGGRPSPAQPPRAISPYVTYVEVEVRQKFRHGTPFQTTVYDEITTLPYSVCDVIRVTANRRFIKYCSEKTLTSITYGIEKNIKSPGPGFLSLFCISKKRVNRKMFHSVQFPLFSPVFEAICAHLDDATLAAMCLSGSKKAAASAMREAEKRPVFALVHSAVTMKEKKKHWIFEEVCETGSLWGVRFLWKSGIGTGNSGLPVACKCGWSEVAEFLIAKGANNYNRALVAACKHGRADMAALMVSKGADDFNAGMLYACNGGSRTLAEMMIRLGANDWNGGLWQACRGGSREVAEFMIECGADNFDWGLDGACGNGHCGTAELMLQHGASDFDQGLCEAAQWGHINTALMMISCGATALNEAHWEACTEGFEKMCELLVAHGATMCGDGECVAHDFPE